ncbi:MAG: zinc-ribbon domain-containing protein, partial [Oscillospiraceae bacterium]|nr:zinc-ribbon domain-containing protein [Oscillospiraceae bacterium]
MFCSNCGAKLDDSAKFCPECGHPVNASGTVPAPVAETPAAPAFDTASAASVSGEVPVFQMPGTQPVIEQDPTVNQAPILEMPASSAPQTFSNVDPEPFRQDAPSYPEPIQFPEPPVFPDDPQPAAQTSQQSAPLYQQSSSIYQQPSAGTQTASANATQYNLNSTGQLPPTTGTYNTAAVQDNGKKSKKGSNSRYILPIIIVGLLIAAGWYFLFGGNSSNEPKVTDPTQLEEYQIAVEAFDSG